jgi:transcriptional regulator with XRE-family HTH domain
MRTLTDIAAALGAQFARVDLGKLKLAEDAGITYRTLSHVLGGAQDYKVSTLLAVADRLGLELVLLPKAAAAALAPPDSEVREPEVQSRVRAALDRLRGGAIE